MKYFLGYIGLIWATSSIPEDGCYSLLGFEGAALSFLCQELIRGWFLLGLGANPFHKTDAPLHHPEIPEALPRCQVHTCCNLPDKPGNNCPFDIFFFSFASPVKVQPLKEQAGKPQVPKNCCKKGRYKIGSKERNCRGWVGKILLCVSQESKLSG